MNSGDEQGSTLVDEVVQNLNNRYIQKRPRLSHGLSIFGIATQGSNLKVLFSSNEYVSPKDEACGTSLQEFRTVRN